MLLEILKEIRASGGAVTVEMLSRRLDASPDIIADQLELLVRKGRLRKEMWGGTCPVAGDGEPRQALACELCALRAYCTPARVPFGTIYLLPEERIPK